MHEDLVVTERIDDIKPLGFYIRRLCDGKETYRMQRRASLQGLLNNRKPGFNLWLKKTTPRDQKSGNKIILLTSHIYLCQMVLWQWSLWVFSHGKLLHCAFVTHLLFMENYRKSMNTRLNCPFRPVCDHVAPSDWEERADEFNLGVRDDTFRVSTFPITTDRSRNIMAVFR